MRLPCLRKARCRKISTSVQPSAFFCPKTEDFVGNLIRVAVMQQTQYTGCSHQKLCSKIRGLREPTFRHPRTLGQPRIPSPHPNLHVVGVLRFMSKTQTNRACPPLFILFLYLFLSLWPFQLYFIQQILPTTLRFFILFFRSYFCLIGPFNYISLYENLFSPYIIPSG